MPKVCLVLPSFRLQTNPEDIVNGFGSGPVCIFVMKCSRLVKSTLEIPLPLPNQSITKIRSKHTKGNQRAVFSVVNKVLDKN